MRTLIAALLLATAPAAAAECNSYRDVGTLTTITLSEDGRTATETFFSGDQTVYDLGTCGTGLVAACGRGANGETILIVHVYGSLAGEDKPKDMLIVDGSSAYIEACDQPTD